MAFTMRIGSIIKEVLDKKGISVIQFSKMIPCSRANAYKIVSKENLDGNLLKRISEILNYDFFFKEYSHSLHLGDNQQNGDRNNSKDDS